MDKLEEIKNAYVKISNIVSNLKCFGVKCSECPFDENVDFCDKINKANEE